MAADLDYMQWIKIVELHIAGHSEFNIAAKMEISIYRIRSVISSHDSLTVAHENIVYRKETNKAA